MSDNTPLSRAIVMKHKRIDVVHLIGTLDRCISEMLVMADNISQYDEPDRQTLKHHAEDAVLAGNKVLKIVNPKLTGEEFSRLLQDATESYASDPNAGKVMSGVSVHWCGVCMAETGVRWSDERGVWICDDCRIKDETTSGYLFHAVEPIPRCKGCKVEMRLGGNLSLHEVSWKCPKCHGRLRVRVQFVEGPTPEPDAAMREALDTTP